MPIAPSQMIFYASTPATGSSKMLGGAIQTGTVIARNEDPASPIFNAIFRDFTNTERRNGARQYHCIFLKNTHATLSFTNGKIWFSAVTPNPDTYARMGLELNAKTTAARTIANDTTAPSGIDLETRHNAVGESITLPTLAPNDYVAIWIQIELKPNSAIYNKDWFEIRVEGTTPA